MRRDDGGEKDESRTEHGGTLDENDHA